MSDTQRHRPDQTHIRQTGRHSQIRHHQVGHTQTHRDRDREPQTSCILLVGVHHAPAHCELRAEGRKEEGEREERGGEDVSRAEEDQEKVDKEEGGGDV
eukprot:2686475-Rhodomonas_salina.1